VDDESIVPKRNVTEEIQARQKTPVLRADATDDELDDAEGEGKSGTRYAFAKGGIVKPGRLVCPICGLEACGHNLPLIPEDPGE